MLIFIGEPGEVKGGGTVGRAWALYALRVFACGERIDGIERKGRFPPPPSSAPRARRQLERG